MMTHNPVMPFPPKQDRSLRKVKPSSIDRKQNNRGDSIAILPSTAKVVEWSKMLTFAGNAMVLQLGNQGKRPHTYASEEQKNVFLDVYIRLRMVWIFDLMELKFSLQQYSGNPSIQALLRTHIRVEKLPLEDFFEDIYGQHRMKFFWQRIIQRKRKQKKLIC